MNQSLLPLPLQTFTNKLKTFTIYNIIFALWIIAQLVIFAATTASVSCSEMKSIYIFLTFSYVAELFVPIGALLIVRSSSLYVVGYAYITLVFLYKIGFIVAIGAYAWYHAGLCYMQKSTNIVYIIINCFEMVCLIVEILLLYRIKKVNRQILLNNLISKKTFAQN